MLELGVTVWTNDQQVSWVMGRRLGPMVDFKVVFAVRFSKLKEQR